MKKKSKTRFCTPFTIKCLNCGIFTYKNKRQNSIQEVVKEKEYHGVPVYRFSFKCTGCLNLLSILTDPKSGQYLVENNAIRIDENSNSESDELEVDDIKPLQESIRKLYDIENKNKKNN